MSAHPPDCPFTGKFCSRGCRSLCERSLRDSGLDPAVLQRPARGPLPATAEDGGEEARTGVQKRS